MGTTKLNKMFTRVSSTLSLGTNATETQANVVCFHGNGANSDISTLQLANLGGLLLDRTKEGQGMAIHHVQAPYTAPANNAFVQEYSRPPFSSWWETDSGADIVKSLEAAVEHLQAQPHILANAENNIAYGFSAGAAVCALLSVPAVCEAMGLERTPWRAVVLTCAAGGDNAIAVCASELSISLAEMKADIPSFHAIALDDPLKARGEQIAALFATHTNGATIIRSVAYFPGSHGVPRALAKDVAFQASFNEWLRCAEQVTTANASSAVVRVRKMTMTRKLSTRSTFGNRSSDVCSITSMLNSIDMADVIEGPVGSLRMAQSHSIVRHEPKLPKDKIPTSLRMCLSQPPGGSPFVRKPNGKHAVSYESLLTFIDGDGDVRRIGITRSDDVVLFPAPPGPIGAIAALVFACQCTAAPFDPRASKAEWVKAIGQINPKVIVSFDGLSSSIPHLDEAAAECNRSVRMLVPRSDDTGYFDVVAQNLEATGNSRQLTTSLDDISFLLMTSGTTSSKSKLVPLRAGALVTNGTAIALSLRLTSKDVCLNVMPLNHIAALTAPLLGSACAGAQVLCAEKKFEPSAFLDLVVSTNPRPTWFTAVPTMHVSLVRQAGEHSRAPPHSLRLVRSGAAALSHADAAAIRSYWGVPVVTSYGMSEQMPITSSTPDDGDTAADDGTVGKPVSSSSIAIVDDVLRPVEIGVAGEVCISDPCMTAYRDEATANRNSFFLLGSERFFRTGDMGKLDATGSLQLVGRAKELIKKGGEQVNPLEVEEVINEHPDVNSSFVFGVQSPIWGDEVGAAVILSAATLPSEDMVASLRQHCADRLVALKVPTHFRIVAFEDLPMTKTNKVKRIGLAEHLGVVAREDGRVGATCSIARAAPPARPSIALNGLRYVAAVGVMFNHIGAVWQGEDERNPRTFGPSFHSARASTLYFPATIFFVLGGFQLSATLAARPVQKRGKFYRARLQTLMPLYLLAVFLALINLTVTCNHRTYSEQFSWQPHPETMSGDARCQSSPVAMPYGLWLCTTVLVFALGLQAWFPFWLLSGWLLFYAWFNSVYHFVIFVFPSLHNALVKDRGNRPRIWLWIGAWSMLTVASAGLMALSYAFPAWKETADASLAKSWIHNQQNIYALAMMLFPPYWVPCVGLGCASYFWFDATRPHEMRAEHSRWYGWTCDVLTVAFVAFHAAMFFDLDFPYPTSLVGKMWEVTADEAHTWDVGMKRYIWSVLITRMYTPLIAAWIALLAIPNLSATSRVLSWNPLSRSLAPTAYGCFLFHQIVGQWYWWITRSGAKIDGSGTYAASLKGDWSWWSYPKNYYWFSPQPMPVAWYEFYSVVSLTTLFSAFVNAVALAPLTRLYTKAVDVLLRKFAPSPSSSSSDTNALDEEEQQDYSARDIVADTVEELTGLRDMPDSMTLDELGLTSVSIPVLVGLLSAKDDSLAHLATAEVASVRDLGELVQLVDKTHQIWTYGAGI